MARSQVRSFSATSERVGPHTRLRVVDAIVSGMHERGTSHHELLRAFQDDDTLGRMDTEAEAGGYRNHEFGDSVFLARRQLTFNGIASAASTAVG